MELEVRSADGITVVGIRGNVDGLTADDLMRAFSERVSEGSVRLVADCASLEYTSSAGLRSLLGAVKLARQHGGDLTLAPREGGGCAAELTLPATPAPRAAPPRSPGEAA